MSWFSKKKQPEPIRKHPEINLICKLLELTQHGDLKWDSVKSNNILDLTAHCFVSRNLNLTTPITYKFLIVNNGTIKSLSLIEQTFSFKEKPETNYRVIYDFGTILDFRSFEGCKDLYMEIVYKQQPGISFSYKFSNCQSIEDVLKCLGV